MPVLKHHAEPQPFQQEDSSSSPASSLSPASSVSPAKTTVPQVQNTLLDDVVSETMSRPNKSLQCREREEPSPSDEFSANLIDEGQGLVRSIALRIHRSLPVRMDLDDLIAYGQVGLAQAAMSFDPAEGTKFTTFAFYRVQGAIYDGVSKMTWTSRARMRRLKSLAESESDFGTKPRVSDVGLAGESACLPIDNALDLHELPSRVAASREMQQTLRKLVAELPSEMKRLVQMVYFEGFTLTEAADRMGISKSWASRQHSKGLDELARALRAIDSE